MLWFKTSSAFLVLALFAADFIQAQQLARLRRDDDGGELLPNGRRGKIRRIKKLRQQGVGTARGFSQKPFVAQAPALSADSGIKRGGGRPAFAQQQTSRQAKAIDNFESVKQPQFQQQFQQQQSPARGQQQQQQLLPAPIQRVQQQLRPIQQFQPLPAVSKQGPAVQGFQQQQGLLRQQQQQPTAFEAENDEQDDEPSQLQASAPFVPNSIPRADVKRPQQQQQSFIGGGSAGSIQSVNRPLSPPVPIRTQDFTIDDLGNYQFNFETGDQVQRVESGQQITRGQDEKLQAIEGSYSYTGPDGKQYTVRYIADENGFQPIGDHIPRLPKVSRNPNVKQ